MYLFDVRPLSAFQIIAGPVSNREKALQIIDFALNYYTAYTDGTAENQTINEYRDLAEKETVDSAYLDWLTQWLDDILEDDLPEYCEIRWQEGYLTILPDPTDAVNNLMQRGDRHWDEESDTDINPDNDDHIVEVNDHGNVTLYAWTPSEKDGFVNHLQHEWQEVWAVV